MGTKQKILNADVCISRSSCLSNYLRIFSEKESGRGGRGTSKLKKKALIRHLSINLIGCSSKKWYHNGKRAFPPPITWWLWHPRASVLQCLLPSRQSSLAQVLRNKLWGGGGTVAQLTAGSTYSLCTRILFRGVLLEANFCVREKRKSW